MLRPRLLIAALFCLPISSAFAQKPKPEPSTTQHPAELDEGKPRQKSCREICEDKAAPCMMRCISKAKTREQLTEANKCAQKCNDEQKPCFSQCAPPQKSKK